LNGGKAANRIFLLSPANPAGTRAKYLIGPDADSPLARQLRLSGVPLGDLYSFVSSLYFRGKLTYARTFAKTPPELSGAFVITSCMGLVPPGQSISLTQLQKISDVALDPGEARYRGPLERDARALLKQAGSDAEVILLGSIATSKYVEPLLDVFGERLMFPVDFVGRGDMSRGGLMLRCARSGVELKYTPVAGAQRHGIKPPKLPPVRPADVSVPSWKP
jgi:hypothetical protein